ncbi:MAG: DUF2293 domain-containing protein [Bacteroidales bacterium]|nr:DUF2293 domain-containing protein [Bacteroidales bacterium]
MDFLLVWSKSRKRFERNGIYVEASAIETARIECEQDKEKREQKNQKAAVVAEIKDKEYIHNFGLAIRAYFPRCPQNREFAIAAHACEKHSGRVGRTAYAKQFDPEMIERAVEAHIRHTETNYDSQFGKARQKGNPCRPELYNKKYNEKLEIGRRRIGEKIQFLIQSFYVVFKKLIKILKKKAPFLLYSNQYKDELFNKILHITYLPINHVQSI